MSVEKTPDLMVYKEGEDFISELFDFAVAYWGPRRDKDGNDRWRYVDSYRGVEPEFGFGWVTDGAQYFCLDSKSVDVTELLLDGQGKVTGTQRYIVPESEGLSDEPRLRQLPRTIFW